MNTYTVTFWNAIEGFQSFEVNANNEADAIRQIEPCDPSTVLQSIEVI